MAQALLKIGFFVFEAFAGAAAAATLGAGAAVAIGAAVVVGGTLIAKQAMSLFEVEMPTVDTDASRQRTVKSTTEPQKIIYGEALVSGPISFIGLSGTDNSDLYQTIVLAGHELNDITDIHMDDVVITDSQINGGSDAGGNVTAGTFGPKNSSTICVIKKHLGEASQTADVLLTGPFANYTSAHRGDGIAYLAMKWVLNEDSAETWEKFAPSNVKALVQGKSIYDPRLEFAAVGTRGQDTTNASYITYSTNPALCVVDYLTDTYLGMGIAVSKIDWDSVTTAADGCDVSVSVPNGTESRFTCNGVVFATDSHQKNINKILSAMNGNLVYSNGKYIVHAGIYEAPTETLNEDDLIGAISIRTSLERSDRFNTIKGLFIDPAQNHKSTEFPKVQLADAVTRDNNEILEKEVQYPMTNSSYMAQRLSNKLIQLSDQQKVVTFPANLSALRITAGDRVQVTVEELSWSNKVFQCAGWTFSEDGGVNLTLREDSSTSYADPAVNEYSTVTATGSITDAFRGVPSPSGLTATAGLKSNELNWVNPAKPNDFGTIYVYASRNANFSSAIKIGETDGTQFIHDASNKSLIFFPSVVNVGDTYTIRTLGNTDFTAMGAASNTVGVVFTATATGSGTGNLWETLSSGNLRYYWVRAVKNVGTDAASQSNLEPNADPNTTVFATVGRVEWADVSGSTDAPADNATVGAQLSVNLYDANGSTVLSDVDVKNSILAQEILEVEVEAGEVLNLETGQDVDIQNLGDVAIYVSDSNQTLNTSINTVANNLSALETVVVDLTSGVSEVFVQATAPVAGVGGIPDPIPDFSRWYDSSNNNQPYYWDGSAWQDLRDGQTTQNEAAITNLQTSLTTTNSNVTTNASAITVLDATSVTQGNSITSITSDVTALETTVNDPSTGVAATSTALGNLTTRVTTAEGSITTNASDITTLQTDVTTAEGNITTNAGAISGLDTRVTTAEGSIVSQASDITALESTVNDGTTGVAANASGLSALTTRVTDNEDGVEVNAGAVTSLNATYTEDLHFRTQAEDENDDLIDLETSGTVELQDLTDFVSGSSAAIDSLTVQTFANENGIQTQAIQLTALESTVNDPTNGVVATAGALSSLSTTVSVIDGQVTSTAQDLTTLTTTVGENTASITTQATSIDGVEANYSVKIDNNNRITGFGLLSTTSGATPFSEFAVVADQFSIVSPDSTADTPIQPFTVTADKIYFGADVIVSGDLISTGTISADRLQIDGVMFDTETVGGVTSLIIKESGINTSQIAESAITTARLSNDSVTIDKFANTLESTNYSAGSAGWKLTTDGTFEAGSGTFRGAITATSLALSEGITIAKSVVGLTNVENLDAQDQAQTGLIAGTTITGGGITMSSGGAIKTTGKDSESDTTNGYFLGYNSSSTKYTFGIGDADRSMVWDGSKLNISGDSISLRTGGDVDYTSDSRYPTSVKSSAITLTSDSDYFLFDTRFQDIAFPEFLVTYNLGPLTSGTQSSLSAANGGIMDQIKVEVFYSDASSGSPSTWVSFASKTVGKIYTWNESNSAIYFNFRVKQVDLGGGNYRADLDTRSGILDDYPLSAAPFSSYFGGTSVPVGLVDEDYNINIPVYRNTFVLPKGKYFIKTVITVTDGSTSPYPSTGSPTATNRIVSIANANNYTHPDYGQSSYYQGNPKTTFVDPDDKGMTLLNGNSVYLMTREGDSGDEVWQNAMFFGGRGTSNANAAYGNLHGLYFYNDRDDIGSGSGIVGSLGSVNHAITVPYLGDSLNITATGNGIKFNGGYGSTGATIDTNGNYFANGNITISGTVSQGSDARLKTDVETIDGSKVFDMRGVSFTKAGKKGAGVIAQELQEIAPELVHEDQDGVLSVAYGDIVGYLIEAIKTLKQEIESIKADD
jgi:hypothetical protein